MDRRRQSHDDVLVEKPKFYDVVDAFKCYSPIHDRIPGILKTHLLIAYREKFATVEPGMASTVQAHKQAQCYLYKYKESSDHTNGLPVAICGKIGEKNYVLEAGSNSVDILEKQLPKTIPSKTSGLIFYMQEFAIGHSFLRFESSSQKGYCLAWNTENKLTLKLKDPNDETQAF
ncbi:hypothetical protein PRIEUP_LOCUS35, partial [Pristimantis euphronides]